MPRRAGRRGDGRCAVAEAESPAGGEGGGKSGSAFGFLGHKVFGKVPVWVIAVAAVGAYYWYTKYGPGKKNAAAQGTQGTDPAGNTGTIDPATGFVYGSPEDLAVLAGSSGTSSAGNYQDWQDQQGGGGGGSGGGTVSPIGNPVTPQCPGGAHWDAAQGMCVFGAGEGPVPGTTTQPNWQPWKPGPGQPFIPGVGSLGEGQVPRPKPKTAPKRGAAGTAPGRSLATRPKAS